MTDVVAIIPARGGSKGIRQKNLQSVGGTSLVGRSIRSCLEVPQIDQVFVSTDASDIAACARSHGAGVIPRPPELAGDQATSESALLHALANVDQLGTQTEVLVFVQCTSPFIDTAALGNAIDRVQRGDAHSVFAGVETYEFLWAVSDEGTAVGLNHDHRQRLRRQDRQPFFRETGAFYVMTADGFRKARHRFFGRVAAEPVAQLTSIEIDEPHDLVLADALAAYIDSPSVGPPTETIRAVAMDFDGVHTDDRVYVHQDGTEAIVANRSDGHGIKLLREAGLELVILSTETNPVVTHRAAKLQVECIHGVEDKLAALDAWRTERSLPWSAVAYIGNDVNDLSCLRAVGLAVAVADAMPSVREVAHITTQRCGGDGAVRELAQLLLSDHARNYPLDIKEMPV